MIDRHYATLMAEYNAWMNAKLYDLCAGLADAERKRERGAFFGSIHGTLNHLVWADRAFHARLHEQPLPTEPVRTILFERFEDMRAERVRLDAAFVAWARGLADGALEQSVVLRSVVYKTERRLPRYVVVVQMFNHQTHHRGQLTTLLSQLGIDPGMTDIPFMPFTDSLVLPS